MSLSLIILELSIFVTIQINILDEIYREKIKNIAQILIFFVTARLKDYYPRRWTTNKESL